MKKYSIDVVEKRYFRIEIEAKNSTNAKLLVKDYYDMGNYNQIEKRLQEPKIVYRGMIGDV
jgi:hypothetical protein